MKKKDEVKTTPVTDVPIVTVQDVTVDTAERPDDAEAELTATDANVAPVGTVTTPQNAIAEDVVPAGFAAERVRREEQATLNAALAKKRCGNCAITGNWSVYSREREAGRVRYVRCKCCGASSHVAVVAENSGGAI